MRYLLCIISFAPVFANDGWVNQEDILSGIFETGSWNEEDFQDLDSNKDGNLDVIDLLLHEPSPYPIVTFRKSETRVVEGTSTLALHLKSSQFIRKTIPIIIEGVSELGVDIQLPTRSVTFDGRDATLVIQILNDQSWEPIEWFSIRLQQGDDYRLDESSHQVIMDDNEALWTVVLLEGGAQYGFDLAVEDDGQTARLISEGNSLIPEGTFPVEVDWGSDEFSLAVNDLPISASGSLLNVSFELSISMTASTRVTTHQIGGNRLIGSLLLTWSAQGFQQSHHNHTKSGLFILSKHGDLSTHPTILEAE